jgi:hypothetical protein
MNVKLLLNFFCAHVLFKDIVDFSFLLFNLASLCATRSTGVAHVGIKPEDYGTAHSEFRHLCLLKSCCEIC